MRWRPAILSLILVGIILPIAQCAGDEPTTAPSASAREQPADIAAPKLGRDGQMDEHFQKMHDSFLQRRTQGPIDILFLGDSITEGWSGPGRAQWEKYYAPLNAANFGIGGDRTQHVLWRIDNGELDDINPNPKVLVLLIGTNNIGYSAQEILAADTKIVHEIHDKLPQTKVLLLAIFPRGADPKDPAVAAMREKIETVNMGLAALDDGDKTRFLDIGSKFLDADGKISRNIMYDFLHPTAKGYQIWVDAMAPLLGEMMK
jgi:lysophospholipase L1-like esterase